MSCRVNALPLAFGPGNYREEIEAYKALMQCWQAGRLAGKAETNTG